MIGSIKGKIKLIKSAYLLVENNGIGYRILVSPNLIDKFKPGEEREFFIHQHIAETNLDLYGFETEEELEMFELLLTVSGVGPRAGQAILSSLNVEQIKSAIIQRDPNVFLRVSGIGKKTAERIIVDLQSKLKSSGAILDIKKDEEVIGALKNLGFKMHEISKILEKIPENLPIEEKIKTALKELR